ncbi:MAG TPA: DUF1127 domain-containing protein [Alphaproteobacteria bacterium]|nr:DUF1127 domain-containing protein [Alphaproteobacteria bacterium]
MTTMPRNVTLSRSAIAQSWFLGLALRLLAWQERARQRRALLQLDDALLKDIGLTRADVERECGKPFWR